jgi:hypothetical protein
MCDSNSIMSSDAYGSVSNAAMQQVEGMKKIPGRVYANWPVFFGFTAVDYLYSALLNMVPQLTGTAGQVENIALNGMIQVVKMVTWESLKVM